MCCPDNEMCVSSKNYKVTDRLQTTNGLTDTRKEYLVSGGPEDFAVFWCNGGASKPRKKPQAPKLFKQGDGNQMHSVHIIRLTYNFFSRSVELHVSLRLEGKEEANEASAFYRISS